MLALLCVVLIACTQEAAPPDAGGDGDEACIVPSLQEQFPEVPNPLGDWDDAEGCVAMEHDVILVLGCPTNPDGTASDCQRERADIALGLHAGGLGHRFITSGGAVQNEWVEADTLEQLLVDGGIPESAITTEPLAEHTDENLYFASTIMAEQGFRDAIVVTNQPTHLLFTAVSDANCCVGLGRLSVFDFPVGGETALLGHYELYPWAEPVTDAECEHIEAMLMSFSLPSRLACAEDFQL